MAKLMLQKKKPKPPVKRNDNVRHFVWEWRTYRKMTQDKLAELVDRSRGLISQIESGETALTEDMIYAIAKAVRCDPWDLLRVNPLDERVVADITDALRGQPPDVQAEALGFVRGIVRGAKS